MGASHIAGIGPLEVGVILVLLAIIGLVLVAIYAVVRLAVRRR